MSDKSAHNAPSCSFCGKSQDAVRKLLAGPTVFICDECIDLANDIIEQETESPDIPLQEWTQEPSGSEYLMKPQIVTRYVTGPVAVARASDLNGVYWTCDGCGWRLKLAPGAAPPGEHSEEIVLGFWPDSPEKVPPRELVPNCPNPAWRKVF